jgi:hypothetical protein
MTDVLCGSTDPETTSSFEDVVELALLLSAAQASELEDVAFRRGLTAGEMVRRLVHDFLADQKARAAGASRLF